MKTLLSLALLVSTIMAYAQETKGLKVSISVVNQGKERRLISNVSGGSGDYYISWNSSAMYGINTDKSLSEVIIPLDEEDISYDVYVRDRKTGVMGWKSINFSRPKSLVKLLAYPNPSQEYITLKADQASDGTLDYVQRIVKAELFSERNGKLIKSIPIKDENQTELSMNVKDLAKGVYYVHLTLSDNVHAQHTKEVVRILVGNESK